MLWLSQKSWECNDWKTITNWFFLWFPFPFTYVLYKYMEKTGFFSFSDLCSRIDCQRQDRYLWSICDRPSGKIQKENQNGAQGTQPWLEWKILFVSINSITRSRATIMLSKISIYKRTITKKNITIACWLKNQSSIQHLMSMSNVIKQTLRYLGMINR